MGENKGTYRGTHLLFEIEGVPGRRRLKKIRNYVAVYADRLVIDVAGSCETYTKDDIDDIYIQEPLVEDIDDRTVRVDLCEDENGELSYYELDDEIFPGFTEKMEEALKNEWSHIRDKYNYPETIKWFVGCCFIVRVSSQVNPYIFSGERTVPVITRSARDNLYESWGFSDRGDLLEMLPLLLEGYSIQKNQDTESNSALRKKMERCYWAWDLQRVIWLCSLGCFCGYLSLEEALDWSLLAGQELQKRFRSWDDFLEKYLQGYSNWAEEDVEDEESEAYERKQIYDFYMRAPNSPWSVRWDMELTKEW